MYLGATLTFFCRTHADEFAEAEKRNEYLKDKTKYKCLGIVCEYYGDMYTVYEEIATGKMIYT